VVDRLNPILHLDPVFKLPPELTYEIFSYLDPRTLLNASLASRSWRERILDSGLWKFLYINEGWRMDVAAVRAFEQEHSEAMSPQSRKSRLRHSDSDLGEPKHKKRVPPTWNYSRSTDEHRTTVFGPMPTEADNEGDHHMTDDDDQGVHSFSDESEILPTAVPQSPLSFYPPLRPSLLLRDPHRSAKLNWAYLYKQRRRLEANWHHGRYTNFQLPDPSHPEEAHRECVYAIQFEGRWLVSGSRDRTVRVWNLDTRRLRHPPLVGHTKSVLCLQFDPRPEEDIIISGSSDKSVIVWKFSTGEKIHQIELAHIDSVLNLKFDKRYLVTCSKDRTVKVWNRRDLLPNNEDYPRMSRGSGVTYPSYIVDLNSIAPNVLEAGIAHDQYKLLKPYTLLMTVQGHGAAVNAMQIHGDEIVTASGDRTIKVWNIRTGACSKTLTGHEKGIACIEFDSRRIISGSNDNTVRIYDHVSGAPVACLRGHSNLVRTLQAGFGDPPGADETLQREARAVDNDFFAAQEAGLPVALGHREQQRNGYQTNTAGSRDPRDITALGAKIPPGGGGSNWARIVSGSYDESIMIWHKDRDGKWTMAYQLRQSDAVANATRSSLSQVARTTVAAQAQQLHAEQASAAPTTQAGGQVAVNTNAQAGPANPPLHQTQAQPLQVVAPAAINAQPPVPPLAHHHHHHVHPRRPTLNPQPTSRVFKLQFDSRKIICASVDPRIVGWDFACDDEEIIEACPFFQGL
jgi:F-box and WD-40 domain protein 1/11